MTLEDGIPREPDRLRMKPLAVPLEETRKTESLSAPTPLVPPAKPLRGLQPPRTRTDMAGLPGELATPAFRNLCLMREAMRLGISFDYSSYRNDPGRLTDKQIGFLKYLISKKEAP